MKACIGGVEDFSSAPLCICHYPERDGGIADERFCA
jgi:hypothetical protein